MTAHVPSQSRIVFTQEQDDFLRKHWPADVKTEWIVSQFPGLQRRQVRDRANKLGLKRPKATMLTASQVHHLKSMWERGIPCSHIAERFNLTIEQARRQASMRGFYRPEWFIKKAKLEAAREAAGGVIDSFPRQKLEDEEIAALYVGQRYKDVRLAERPFVPRKVA